MVLAQDASNVITWYHEEGGLILDPPFVPGLNGPLLTGASSELWLPTCRVLLSQLTAHIDSLATKLIASKTMKDEEGCEALRCSSVISFTTLAQICITFARDPLSTPADRLGFLGRCNDALDRVFSTIEEMKPLELRYMDSFLGVGVFIYSFNAVVDLAVWLVLLDSRTLTISSCPFHTQYSRPCRRSRHRVALSDHRISDAATFDRLPGHILTSSSFRP